MNGIFRVDASVALGTGHVMRCLALAEELRGAGWNVSFICRELAGNLCCLIETQGFAVHRLPKPDLTDIGSGPGSDKTYDGAVGLDWHNDIQDTEAALASHEGSIDWLIVDHYAIDKRWETRVQSYAARIMVIDDLANRPHHCDLLLDQNLHENQDTRYQALVPALCLKLLGPAYALLRSEFHRARSTMRRRDAGIGRIFIFFGGTDPANVTLKAVEAIRLLDRPDIEVDVVVGAGNLHGDRIGQACAALPNVSFHCQVTNMATLMANADLAIGATGTATWERLCVGLPALVVSVAENQEEVARNTAKAGVCFYLGKASEISAAIIVRSIKRVLADCAQLAFMSAKATAIVDGLGAQRAGKVLNSFS